MLAVAEWCRWCVVSGTHKVSGLWWVACVRAVTGVVCGVWCVVSGSGVRSC